MIPRQSTKLALFALGALAIGCAGAPHSSLAAAGTMAPSQAAIQAYTRIATWSSADEPESAGLYKAPTGIEVGPDGTIYVADARIGALHVLNSDGTPRALWGGQEAGLDLGDLRDIAVGQQTVYVSDATGGQIHRFRRDGQYEGSWSMQGNPGGLAAAGDELYVVASERAEVVVLGPDGKRRRAWDPESSPLEVPWGIDIGPDGKVFVTDLAAKRIWIFDSEGVLTGGLAVVVDQVQMPPVDVAADDDGDLFILTELRIFRQQNGVSTGQPIDSPGGRGVAVGPGSGLVTAVQDHRLGFTGVRHIRDRRSTIAGIEQWGNPFAPLGSLEAPRRLSVNSSGRVFVLDTWPRVQTWSTQGAPISQFPHGGLHDVTAGLRGSVYGVDGRFLRYWTQDGTPLWQWQPPSTDPQAGNPYGWLLATDSHEGELAVFDMGDQRVHVTDFSGNPRGEWPVSAPDGFESIADVALTPDAVYLANRNRRQVVALSREDGLTVGEWDVPGIPSRIDAAAGGKVHALTRDGWILRYGVNGTIDGAFEAASDRSATDLAVGDDSLVYVAFADSSSIGVFAPDPAGAPPEIPTYGDRCRLQHDKTAEPAAIDLGQRVTVRLTVEGECPIADGRSDLLLLVDTSGSMGGTKMGAARSAVMEFVGQLDYSLNQVGLISFSTQVELVQELTDNPRALIRSIPDLGDDEGTNMFEAFQLAESEFAGPRARPEARQVMVLLTDGRPNSLRGELVAMADEYRGLGRDVYAIGLGMDVDRQFLRSLVTEPRYYFEAPSEHDLRRIYDTIAGRVAASALLARTTVTDELPENMRYSLGSAVPAARYSPSRRTLYWQLSSVPPGGLTLRYNVEPLEPGRHPTNVAAQAEYVDGVGHEGRLEFPVPLVEVTQPKRWEAYLPSALRRQCPEVHADIVLAVDTSSSMRMGDPGDTKLDAAVHAARRFLGLIRLPIDRAAVVAFNSSATIVAPLTGDHLALTDALGRLPTGEGTRLDLGLGTSRQVLDQRLASHVPVVVLLTDGRQSAAPRRAVVDAADRLRSSGIVVFTIGLGADADLQLLRQVAGHERRAFYAPSEADLAEIYRQIAEAIPCQ